MEESDNELIIPFSKFKNDEEKLKLIPFLPIEKGAQFYEGLIIFEKALISNFKKEGVDITSPEETIKQFGAFFVLYADVSSKKRLSIMIDSCGLVQFSIFYLFENGNVNVDKPIIKSKKITIIEFSNSFKEIVNYLR